MGLFGFIYSSEAREYDPICEKNFVDPVTKAIIFEDFEEAKQLIEYADYFEIDSINEDGWTALIIASSWEHTEIAELLIAAGEYVDATDEDGWTALMHASAFEFSELAELLISVGADVNAVDNNGSTVLNIAEVFSKEIAELLEEHGAVADEASE